VTASRTACSFSDSSDGDGVVLGETALAGVGGCMGARFLVDLVMEDVLHLYPSSFHHYSQ